MPVHRPVASERVLLFGPPDEEIQQWREMLTRGRIDCHLCESVETFCQELIGSAGAGLVAMEMFTPAAMSRLVDALGHQEPWSDFPLVLMTRRQEDAPVSGLRMLELLEPLGHFTILQRPFTALGLVSAVKSALRARRSQYRVRDGMLQWNRMLRQRDQFLNLLAHEVRNPLNALRSAVQILGHVDPMTSPAIEQRALIERQTLDGLVHFARGRNQSMKRGKPSRNGVVGL